MATLRQWLPTAQSAGACVVVAVCSLLATTRRRALMNQSVMETQYSHDLGVGQFTPRSTPLYLHSTHSLARP